LKITVGLKVFSVALVLMVLVDVVAWINARSTQRVDALITSVNEIYVLAYGDLARSNLRAVEEGLFVRRLIIARLLTAEDHKVLSDLEHGADEKAAQAEAELADARRLIGREIAGSRGLQDTSQLSRLDARMEFLQTRHQEIERARAAVDTAVVAGDTIVWKEKLQELDQVRDLFNAELELTRRDMMNLLADFGHIVQETQASAARYGLVLLILALALGAAMAVIIAAGLVRPLRRLLQGTMRVQQGALDTEVPVTSRDEVGELTIGFNAMMKELRAKARIRETFGRYVDPRIVESIIDRPDRLVGAGERREMTVFFCDMKGFTSLSEGMTPAGMLRVVNHYLSLMSGPIRRNHGIIDKYIGDAIMAFWGPPFTPAEDQARLACVAGLEQLAILPAFRAELPEITGLKRGIPHLDMRIGAATGEVVVGNIGSDVSMSYTVMGDTVNFASRLEGANKAYGTHLLVNARSAELAAETIVFREIDLLLVEGKQDPQKVFEVLGRKGELPQAMVRLAEHYAEGLAAYRGRAWTEAEAAFRAALAVVPDDGPSKVFLERIPRLVAEAPGVDWNGVWALSEK
jgi:class 3 adenylate cyclase